MSSWIDRRINLPFRGGSGSGGSGNSSDNFQLLDKQDIELHLVKKQELRRLKTLRKKWFVLYEDPDNPIDPDRKPSEHRKTRRRRTDGPVVEQGRELDENDILAEDNDLETEYVSLPARLEYYDSEKKWREGGHPKKRIILKDCLDINRKKETANQFVIAIYTLNEGLDILFENDEDMEIWLDLLLCCKNGGRSLEGRIARPAFESVWSVDVIGFTPDQGSSTGSTGFQMSGPHRLCVIEGFLHFYPIGSQEPITFQMREIRKFGSDKRKFRLIIGSNSISGVGELAMFCKDREAAENLQETIRAQMARLPVDPQDSHSRPSRRQTRHIPPPQQARPDWPLATNDPTGSINGRTRSYSDCNKKNSPMARSIPTQKSHLSNLHNLEASRNRTISEGNGHTEIHLSGRGRSGWHRPNLISGSPLSPGSFVSSESAGSSNSVDSDTMAVGSFDNHKYGSTCMTPSSEHPSTTTIIEESSAESCIDPASFRRNRMEEVKDDGRRPSLPVSSIITNISSEVHYTPIEVVSTASSLPFTSRIISSNSLNSTLTTTAGSYAASPPTGSGVLYSTIVSSRDGAFSPPSAPIAGGSDYMLMTPNPAVSLAQQVHSGSSSSTSSLKRHTQLEPERKRLAMLGLEEDPFPNLNHPGVASPSSQSSYNPLDEDDTEPSYLLMSPVGSSGGTLPKRGTSTTSAVGIPSSASYHRRTGSSTFRSSSVDIKEDDDTQYVTMSPPVTLGKQSLYNGSDSRRTSSRAASSAASSTLGTSPSAQLTSHINERLPLFEPLKRSTPTAPSTNDDSGGGYLLMSPVNAENVDKTPRMSLLSEKFRANSVDTSGPPVLRSRDPSSGNRLDAYKRSSLCSEDEVPRGWSPTHPGPPPAAQPDYNPIEDYEDYAPPKAAMFQHHHHSQQPLHLTQRTSTSKSNIIPIAQSSARKTSPASSNSVISGTPNSTDGALIAKQAPLVRSSSDDDLMDDVGESSEVDGEDNTGGAISYSSVVKSRINKPGSRTSNSSLASRGSSSRYIDIPGGGTNKSASSISPNVSGQSSVASTTNSGLASFLGSIFRGRADSAFRNRSDSVPNRPASDGRRRHRTQSEGENLEGNNP